MLNNKILVINRFTSYINKANISEAKTKGFSNV